MAAYRTHKLSKYNGRYHRMIGKVVGPQGKLKPRKFLLGTDERAAELAMRRLEKLWSEIEVDFKRRARYAGISLPFEGSKIEFNPLTGELVDHPVDVLKTGPVWEAHTLAMAEVIRHGGSEIQVLPSPKLPPHIINTEKFNYVARIMDLRERFSVISFEPSDPVLYANQLRGVADRADAGLKHAESQSLRTRKLTGAAVRTKRGRTLYDAIQAYSDYAKASKHGGPNESKDALALKDAISDLPLADFEYDQILAIGDYWRSRPATKRYGGDGKQIAVDTVVGRLKTTSRFIRWLANSSAWEWKAPTEWRQSLKVNKHKIQTETERLELAAGPDHWTDGELQTLYRYATDRERLMMLLGLNLGYAHSELRSFRKEDIRLDEDPPLVRRLRSKTSQYFEAAIWPETSKALHWLAKSQVPKKKEDAIWVVLTEAGVRYPAKQPFANLWKKLYERVTKDHTDFRWLPFKHLRKTAYQLVLEAAESEEVAGAFQGRSKISSDSYASSYGRRIFGRVHQANMDVRKRLQPMFDAAPDAFTKPKPKGSPNISRGKREAIRALKDEGLDVAEIAEQVGVSRATVYRWIK